MRMNRRCHPCPLRARLEGDGEPHLAEVSAPLIEPERAFLQLIAPVRPHLPEVLRTGAVKAVKSQHRPIIEANRPRFAALTSGDTNSATSPVDIIASDAKQLVATKAAIEEQQHQRHVSLAPDRLVTLRGFHHR